MVTARSTVPGEDFRFAENEFINEEAQSSRDNWPAPNTITWRYSDSSSILTFINDSVASLAALRLLDRKTLKEGDDCNFFIGKVPKDGIAVWRLESGGYYVEQRVNKFKSGLCIHNPVPEGLVKRYKINLTHR